MGNGLGGSATHNFLRTWQAAGIFFLLLVKSVGTKNSGVGSGKSLNGLRKWGSIHFLLM
jgi:hypothetical protein